MAQGLSVITPPVPGVQVGVNGYGKPMADDVNTGVARKPYAKLQATAGISYATAVSAVEMGLNVAIEDNDGMTNIGASNHIFIRTAGLWLLQAQINWVGSAAGQRALEIWVNAFGLGTVTTNGTGTFGTRMNESLTVRLAVGDEVIIKGCQNTGANLATEAASVLGGVWLSATMLGA